MKKSILAVAIGLLSSATMADQFSIPKESGWNGHVGVGFGFYRHESNLFAGTRTQDMGDEDTNLDRSPETNSQGTPELSADVRYTWGDRSTQFFFGSLVEDQVRLDWTQQAGLRKKYNKYGIVGGSVLFSTIPVEVWEDPFVEQSRDRTDRDSSGFRISWTQIMNSPIGVNVSYRDIDIDEDKAGHNQRDFGLISADEARDLRRDGDNQHYEVFGRWVVNEHVFMPSVSYTTRNRDGKAEEGETSTVEMTYARFGKDFTYTASGSIGKRDFDSSNPIFNKKADADEYGITAALFWHRPFNYQNWDLRFTAVYIESDSDIDFYDSKVWGGSVIAQYNF